MIVPRRYRPLMPRSAPGSAQPTPAELGEVMDHDMVCMARGMQVYLALEFKKDPGGLIYRYCFDILSSCLANMDRLLKNNQVGISDLQPLIYDLKRIAVYEYPHSGTRGDKVFQPSLNHTELGHSGVMELGRRLGLQNWKTPAAPQAQNDFSSRSR